jgi:hypothetical protein
MIMFLYLATHPGKMDTYYFGVEAVLNLMKDKSKIKDESNRIILDCKDDK